LLTYILIGVGALCLILSITAGVVMFFKKRNNNNDTNNTINVNDNSFASVRQPNETAIYGSFGQSTGIYTSPPSANTDDHIYNSSFSKLE
jgi:hypothetical protein